MDGVVHVLDTLVVELLRIFLKDIHMISIVVTNTNLAITNR